MPSASFSAVSNDSAILCLASGRTRSRSTTTSMVCLILSFSTGGSERSQSSPSIIARIYPWRESSESSSLYSPFLFLTTGARIMIFVPSGFLRTASVISVTV